MDHRQVQAGDAICGEVDGVAAVFEVIAQVGGDVGVVFYDENAHPGCPVGRLPNQRAIERLLANNLPLCSVGFRPPRWRPVPALV
jgi:hypothetical protein